MNNDEHISQLLRAMIGRTWNADLAVAHKRYGDALGALLDVENYIEAVRNRIEVASTPCYRGWRRWATRW